LPRDPCLHAGRGERARAREALRVRDRDRGAVVRARGRPHQEDGRASRRHAGPGRAHTPAHGEVWMKIGLTTAALLAFAAAAADRFGPRRDEYERVRSWFVAHGFEVVRDSQFRVALVVAGKAAQVETALGAPIGRYLHGGRTYHAPLAEPSLPASIAASVRGIVGLDDLPKFRPLAISAGGDKALVPSDFATAYGVASLQAAGLTGAGHSIAVIARSNFGDSDVAMFSSNFLSFQLAPVRVFAGADPGILSDEGERIEVLLDTEWAGSLAPGATLNVVIGSQGGNIPEALIKAIDDRDSGAPSGDVITLS